MILPVRGFDRELGGAGVVGYLGSGVGLFLQPGEGQVSGDLAVGVDQGVVLVDGVNPAVADGAAAGVGIDADAGAVKLHQWGNALDVAHTVEHQVRGVPGVVMVQSAFFRPTGGDDFAVVLGAIGLGSGWGDPVIPQVFAVAHIAHVVPVLGGDALFRRDTKGQGAGVVDAVVMVVVQQLWQQTKRPGWAAGVFVEDVREQTVQVDGVFS